MPTLKAGDRVQVVTRDVTAEDEKSGLYYAYFGGLTGSVDTVYDRDDSICVDVDLDSLSKEAHDRHIAMQEAERKKWLDNLSNEARNRLTPEQKSLKLAYKILVSSKDVEPLKGGKPGSGKKSEKSSEDSASDASPASGKGPARAPEPMAEAEPETHRVSEDDLSRAEEEYLRSLQEKSQNHEVSAAPKPGTNAANNRIRLVPRWDCSCGDYRCVVSVPRAW